MVYCIITKCQACAQHLTQMFYLAGPTSWSRGKLPSMGMSDWQKAGLLGCLPKSGCPSILSMAREQGPPTSESASEAVSGFRRLFPGVGVLPLSPLCPTLSACSHFCRASSNSSMPEHQPERRESHTPAEAEQPAPTLKRAQNSKEAEGPEGQEQVGPCGPSTHLSSEDWICSQRLSPGQKWLETIKWGLRVGRGQGLQSSTWRRVLGLAWAPGRPFPTTPT